MSMMNQDNPYAMNQTCKVCGEPAAGFHFGAFTCEGCKSFFGRSYNNLSSISDCKNNGECIINKKNRTACKACRLRKCIMVGMSKSGSRYGRRSNWFKIHCLLQEQQQQAAAAMAAHHSSQQQAAGMAGPTSSKAAIGANGVPGLHSPSVTAAALGMLGHSSSGYPTMYGAPRTKEELMMLGLEEYAAKHAAASPSVSSPESHNSDSSMEANVRATTLFHLSGKHVPPAQTVVGDSSTPQCAVSTAASAAAHPPTQHLRKDFPPFLPLPFPGLSSMPVMPPPAFLPPSHLLFPGYHPALYSHHQGLLKPTQEQQQAVAAAAAVQKLFCGTTTATAGRFGQTLSSVTGGTHPAFTANAASTTSTANQRQTEKDDLHTKCDPIDSNHIPNGSKAAEELTKRFYLDAVLKSQQHSPPSTVTKLSAFSKHDHSISALVTPNSESGRELHTSRQSNCEDDEDNEIAEVERNSNGDTGDRDCDGGRNSANDVEDEDEDLVVSMTPPRSPAQPNEAPDRIAQDNPIDLSMKTASSVSSTLSSKCSSGNSVQAIESDNEAHSADLKHEPKIDAEGDADSDLELEVADQDEVEEDNNTTKTVKNNNNNNNNNSNNNNNNENMKIGSINEQKIDQSNIDLMKRKLNELVNETEVDGKRIKWTLEAPAIESSPVNVKVTTSTALDLSTKV